MARKELNNIEITNANIFWTNFSGIEGAYNPAGMRNFCVELEEDIADKLLEDGWNVKRTKNDTPYLKVKVSWRNPHKQPNIYMVTKKNLIALNERTVGRLDSCDFNNIDLEITPSYWSRPDGKEGYSAYVKTMYATIEEPSFASKYEGYSEAALDEDEELPFK